MYIIFEVQSGVGSSCASLVCVSLRDGNSYAKLKLRKILGSRLSNPKISNGYRGYLPSVQNRSHLQIFELTVTYPRSKIFLRNLTCNIDLVNRCGSSYSHLYVKVGLFPGAVKRLFAQKLLCVCLCSPSIRFRSWRV